MAAVTAFLVPTALVVQVAGLSATQAAQAPVGHGFTVTAGDLSYILKQIKIAERHSATLDATHPCSTLLNHPGDGIPDAEQVPDILTSYGLRTVDGSCNNLKTGDENLAAADQPFPRLTDPRFRPAQGRPADFFGPGDPGSASSSYAQKKGNVFDSEPRTISNLIVDQTSTNPAAIAAAGHPVRSQDPTASSVPCVTDPAPDGSSPGVPANCVPTHQTLFIPNVTTDVGLSPPYNSLFTFFGQFFDHGVDQTVKSGGAVFVPLKADDPLIAGPDHTLGNADDLPASQRFMVLTRAQNQPGPDGVLGDDPATVCSSPGVPAGCDESADDIQNANNTDTPWVDQSQTYTSHPSHQVFLREYAASTSTAAFDATHPASVSTGRLLGGLGAGQTYFGSPDGRTGMATWASVKKQAHDLLGLRLVDADVTNIPMIATDPYGKFTPGARGLPQFVTKTGLVEGQLDDPTTLADETVPVPNNALHFDTPFLTDIAHNADPSPVDTDNNPSTPAVAPVPDADNLPSADFAHQPAGTYDDEMLDSHFSCGDGRCNENIALSTIHQIFHSEHDRLVADINNTLTSDTSAAGLATLADWKATGVSGYGYGERLFQAARFVTEMEYQHLVFEEFARKVQPAVRPFHVYSPDINAAVDAEFAHAVYRFGHSMLDDTVARTNTAPDGSQSDNSLPLLTAFLNPPEFFNGHGAGTLTPEAAAGSIVMGSSDQAGNELDEFVTDTLRNNLLGLPLDLATLNMTRAREAGVAPLNDVRRQIFGQTNDGQLAPYTSWSDFGQHLKHPESLVNFVAAYGRHPSITDATTMAGKRAAAKLIVDPADPTDPAIPADAADFMFSNGAWASNANGVTTTGVDDVDLWVGGLAEVTNLFGGLLGSTFNYVFETQLEKLQDGDRLYYLVRTPGMNIRTQLEGNSFAEMIQRNTDNTNSLKADAFATADCKFQLSHLAGTSAGFASGGSTVADDPTTADCDESKLLLRKPDGTIQYRSVNTVDPVGINGQAVYNGTPAADRVFGGNDNDTFWGGDGNDVIEGNGGDDVALGGNGNDIITDLGGADVPKGGPGNDAVDGGIGDDIVHGGDGQDFLNGGANDNETFAGPGNDFVIAGQGADAVFGDGGDDWIQGGTGQDLLQGDHGAPFFDDPAETAPGNEIFVGQPGENDYDAEGGDDVMSQNAAVDRNAGAGGFDWAIHQYDTTAADDDLMINNNLGGLPIQVIVQRDRWQETEADSGGPLNDTLKGTDGVLSTPRLISGGGFTGCDAIDQAGLARVQGLSDLLPPVSAWLGNASDVAALSASGRCPLTGPVWGEGDILLGGPGSDTITGRSGDEIIDGDKELRVAISVRTDPADPTTEIGSTDLMEGKALTGNFGPGTTGMTLQAAVFAGLVDTGNLVAVRQIVNRETNPADCAATAPKNCDAAVFAGPRSQYDITANPNGTITVSDTTSPAPAPGVVATGDGSDTLRNVEQLKFSDTTLAVVAPTAPTNVTALAGNASATVSWTAPSSGTADITGYTLVVKVGGTVVNTINGISRTALSRNVTGLTNGTAYTFAVRASNQFGAGPFSADSAPVTPSAPAATAPAAPTAVNATGGNAQATLSWTPGANGGSAITGYQVQVRTGTTVVRTVTLTGTASTRTITGLTNGTAYNFRVAAVNAVGTGALSTASNTVTPAAPAAVPAAPTGVTAARGNASATVSWTPGNNGGSAITSNQVQVIVGTTVQRTVTVGAVNSTVVTGLTNGTTYTFRVRSINAVGTGPLSAASNAVTPATVPGAPVIGTPQRGANGGALTAIARWTAPGNNGGSAITGFRVYALRFVNGNVVSTTVRNAGSGVRSLEVTLPAGNYRFQVSAVNAVGEGTQSARSALISPR